MTTKGTPFTSRQGMILAFSNSMSGLVCQKAGGTYPSFIVRLYVVSALAIFFIKLNRIQFKYA